MRPASLGYCAQRLADSLTATTKVPESRKIAAGAIRTAAETKDNPADLINIALEELVKSNCELPGYTTPEPDGRRHFCSPSMPSPGHLRHRVLRMGAHP